MNCDVIDGIIVIGLGQPIFVSFVLDKQSDYKVFCNPETIHYKKTIKSVLNTISSYIDIIDINKLKFQHRT